MASGPAGVGWSPFIDYLNGVFGDDTKRKQFADSFKQKHGDKGDGDATGAKTPYKFGEFVDKGALLKGDNARAQFLIDSGRRHWDSSIDLLELAIKQSLTRLSASGTPDPKKITFISATEDGATKARAEISASAATPRPLASADEIYKAVASGDALTIKIVCPPGQLRPKP